MSNIPSHTLIEERYLKLYYCISQCARARAVCNWVPSPSGVLVLDLFMAGPPPKFWKPGCVLIAKLFPRIIFISFFAGAPKPGALVELERPVEGGEGAGSCLTYNTHINLSIAQQRQRLPIFNVGCY